MLWFQIIDKYIRTRLCIVCSVKEIKDLLALRKKNLKQIQIGATTGFLNYIDDGTYTIEAPCNDRIELERTIFHEVAHWIDVTLHGKTDHGEAWQKIVTALGYPEEVERDKELTAQHEAARKSH